MSERIRQEMQSYAQAALTGSPIYALRSLRVDQDHENALLISGTVDSYYHKQMAQELVRTIAPSIVVVNLIHVASGTENAVERTPANGAPRADRDLPPRAKVRKQRSAG